MQIAMTVGATKIQSLQESTLTAMAEHKDSGQEPSEDACKP